MLCEHCQDAAEDVFNEDEANRNLKDYQKKGPGKPTQTLLDAVMAHEVSGLTLLDIGGGVGAIQHELLEAGVVHTTDVDASGAYVNAARSEAERRGFADRTDYRIGDFVDLAPDIEAADIVTLDKVICCYPYMDKLVALSAERANKLYALVFPRDVWWLKFGMGVMNVFLWLSRSAFRTYVHPTSAVDSLLRGKGFHQLSLQKAGLIWQVAVYSRA